jgi:hypothetical protein
MRKWTGLVDGLTVPTDEQTAEAMRELAEAFVRGMAEEGETFGWESTEAGRLDEICTDVAASRPPQAISRNVTLQMGAYLGELLVRNGGARWTYDPAASAPAVEMPDGLRSYPHGKVAERLDVYAGEDILRFYRYALGRHTMPHAR